MLASERPLRIFCRRSSSRLIPHSMPPRNHLTEGYRPSVTRGGWQRWAQTPRRTSRWAGAGGSRRDHRHRDLGGREPHAGLPGAVQRRVRGAVHGGLPAWRDHRWLQPPRLRECRCRLAAASAPPVQGPSPFTTSVVTDGRAPIRAGPDQFHMRRAARHRASRTDRTPHDHQAVLRGRAAARRFEEPLPRNWHPGPSARRMITLARSPRPPRAPPA